MYYLICKNGKIRTQLIDYLKELNIQAVFHYQSLHNSPYFQKKYNGPPLKNTDCYADCLVRLPLYNNMGQKEVNRIINSIKAFDEEH